MLFNSHLFIFLFLPITLLGYFILNHFRRYNLAKCFLIAMSLWFYAYFNISYLWIILVSLAVNYICHVGILTIFSSSRKISEEIPEVRLQPVARKAYLVVGIVINLGLLFYFKYFNFFVDNLNALFHTSFVLQKIVLPLGISFFTFQQLGFLIDTGRGEVKRQSLVDYALFVTFFPQLIAGPIVNHEEMLPQFQNPALKRPNAENLYIGSRNFILGLAKKVLLADVFGQAVQWGYEHYTLLHGPGVVLVLLFYTFQIYFDFSGYCDMARGIGYLFNIELPVNFFSPYKAVNFVDFWKRWHRTLTRFLTKYLYIPLGGSRKGETHTYLNIFLVFLASGIWHGAGYTFMFWGILHGILYVLTRIYEKYIKGNLGFSKDGKLGGLRKALAVTLTFVGINITWLFFRAESLSQAFTLLAGLGNWGGAGGILEVSSFFVLPEMKFVLSLMNRTASVKVSFAAMLGFCLLLSGMVGLVILVDPFFQYHKPLPGFHYVIDNQLSQNAGMIKHFEYDSVILGSSMTVNFDTDLINALLDLKTIKLSVNAAYPKDIDTMLSLIHRRYENLNTVFLGIDPHNYTAEPGITAYPYPEYLYDTNLLNDCNYLLNKEVLCEYVLLPQTQKNSTKLNEIFWNWPNMLYGREVIEQSYTPPILTDASIPEDAFYERTAYNMENYILPYIREMEDTQFVVFFPPYSILYWYNQMAEGSIAARMRQIEQLTGELLSYPNVRVFYFQNDYAYITDYDNYCDYTHYRHEMNDYMTECFKTGEYELTKENYKAVLQEAKEWFLTFDYKNCW